MSGLNHLDRTARELRSARRVDSIGRLDGSVDDAIGMILDIDVDTSGKVFVLDRAFQMVRVFESNGKPAFTIGRSGSGPLEFRSVIGMWLADSGLIAVDAVLGAKHIALNRAGNASLVRVVRLEGALSAACGSGGKIAGLGPSSDRNVSTRDDGSEPHIRVYDADGGTGTAFGSSYRSDVALVRLVMSEGVVACTESGRILEALSRLPFVRAYTGTGTMLWSVALRDFVVGTSLESRDARGRRKIGVDPNDPKGSFTLRIRELIPGLAVVQVGLMTRESLMDRSLWSTIETYLVEVETGKGVFVGSHLPLLSRVRSRTLYGFENDPFPRVVIFQLGEGAK